MTSQREIKSVPDPGPPSLREAIEGINDNIFDAARAERAALDVYRGLMPGDAKEEVAKGCVTVARIEQAHWRGYLTVYREWLDLHPELADRPVGTKCAHGTRCYLGAPSVREPGADDDAGPPLDPRLPPERDLWGNAP